MAKKISYLTILLMGSYALMLQVRGDIILYIREDYVASTVIAAGVCVVVGLVGLVETYVGKILKAKSLSLPSFNFSTLKNSFGLLRDKHLGLLLVSLVLSVFTPLGIIVLLIVLWLPTEQKSLVHSLGAKIGLGTLALVAVVLGLIIPPATLSAQAAAQRTSNINGFAGSAAQPSTISIFSGNFAKYDVGDWVRRLSYQPDLEGYKGKQVNLTGFVFPISGVGEDKFMLSRFLISCCVVDATPIGLLVEIPDWKSNYTPDSWLNVKGIFDVKSVDGHDTLVVKPSDVQQVSQPERPYIY